MFDFLSPLGLIVGIGSLILAALAAGGDPAMLLQEHAAIIVFGGTLGAMLLETPPRIFGLAMKRLIWLFTPPKFDSTRDVELFASITDEGAQQALDKLSQSAASSSGDPFLRYAIELTDLYMENDVIQVALEGEIAKNDTDLFRVVAFYEAAGGYSPTMGIMGAVIGLMVAVMGLGQESVNLAALGTGIATAFVATIYGLLLANMILLPIAGKLKSYAVAQSERQRGIVRAVLAINKKGRIGEDAMRTLMNEKTMAG
jgi:chemotaxis protein MotA